MKAAAGINCVAPEEDEIEALIQDFNIEPDFLRASLDEEESSHIDSEDGNTLIIIDIPVVEKQREKYQIQHDAFRHYADGKKRNYRLP